MGSYRKDCVYKNFLRAVCEVQKSLRTNKVPRCHSNAEESQLPAKQELVRFVKKASKKNFVVKPSKKISVALSEKRKRDFEGVPSPKRQKCDTEISRLSSTTVKKPRPPQTKQIPADFVEVYEDAVRLIRVVNEVTGSYVANQENVDPRDTVGSMRGIQFVNGRIFAKVPTTFTQRNQFARLQQSMADYYSQLAGGIAQSEKYLTLLQSILSSIPGNPKPVQRLAKKLNRANVKFYAQPIHKEFATLGQQIKLLEILVGKFDKFNQRPLRSKVLSPRNVQI